MNTVPDSSLQITEFVSSEMSFYITKDANDFISDNKEINIDSFLCSIYKYCLTGTVPLFYSKVEKESIKKVTRKDLRVIEIEASSSTFPIRIDDIINWIMECLYLKSKEFGKIIENIDSFCFYSNKNEDRFNFFVSTLMDRGLIKAEKEYADDHVIISALSLTIEGWRFIEEYVINRDEKSKNVFVAMWFDKEMDKAYESIAMALKHTGFRDMRIDKKPHNNEISSEIAFEIRKSKFLIAEVTNQRQGVYFEAGYALGQKIPVIWVCRKNDLENVHFDTRQYNHVIWETEEELITKLEDRIKGTIL
jgi:hypothetical protein